MILNDRLSDNKIHFTCEHTELVIELTNKNFSEPLPYLTIRLYDFRNLVASALYNIVVVKQYEGLNVVKIEDAGNDVFVISTGVRYTNDTIAVSYNMFPISVTRYDIRRFLDNFR